MQNRMKTHELDKKQVEALLLAAQVGRMATQSVEGYPYIVPVHFVYYNEKIYIHGLPKGQKVEDISRNPKVGFEVDEMIRILSEGVEVACNVNTEYNSVIIMGNASVISDVTYKREILHRIVEKYTPHLSSGELPENMVRGTAVIGISIHECTGKYYQ